MGHWRSSSTLAKLEVISQTDRAQEIAEQLRGIGGSRSVGFGMQQVRSLPDAVARALEMHLEEQEAAKQVSSSQSQETAVKATSNGKRDEHDGFADGSSSALNVAAGYINVTGNLCPQCGCNTMVREEGW